jgi:hypothetical protein
MFCLNAVVVCRCASSSDVFRLSSSWSCIDVASVMLACRHMNAFSPCVPCIWEKYWILLRFPLVCVACIGRSVVVFLEYYFLCGAGLENREYGRGDPLRWPRDTLDPQKLALTSPTSGGRSVVIVRLRTKATEWVYLEKVLYFASFSHCLCCLYLGEVLYLVTLSPCVPCIWEK